MKKKYFIKLITAGQLLIALLLVSGNTFGQVFTESNLPIVVITTDNDPDTNQPLEIPDDPKILASMKIIWHTDGTTNYMTDINTTSLLNYNGRIGIEIRGSSSQDLPKKGYAMTTLQADNVSNNNVSILGMPSENDWVLNGLAFDPSLIRDYLSYNLARQIGNYATRTVYCEVVINGEYRGLYVMQEKIKADTNRVNVVKITASDITTPNLTGGYITKADKTTGGDPVAWQMDSNVDVTNFIHELPKPEAVTDEQDTYIHGRFTALATTTGNDNANLTFGYPSIIDVPTFIDFMVMNELASNADGYQLSTFFHKDRGGKLRAGPIWDFNLTYGNDLFEYGFDRSHYDVWQFSNGDNEGAKFWTDLFDNTTYKCYLSKRWNQLTQPGQALNHDSLVAFIDETVAHISEAIVRENDKWGTIPNHALEISTLKTFLSNRIAWITTNIGPYSDCSNVVVPSLVINKINYNPGTFPGFTVSNDLEFIEIKNTGTTTVSLTGVYFKELGISYQFPALSSVAANQSVYLASNSTTFQAKYGLTAFGQFTRNLSNSSQKLVLADGFGNIIDSVEYKDVTPWPNADGNGTYLQLIDIAFDNSVGTNWEALDSNMLGSGSFSDVVGLTIYPNPVSNVLTIKTSEEMDGIKIFNLYGAVVYETKEKGNIIQTDFTNYASGIYFITVFNGNSSFTKKVIKQ